MTLAYPSIWTPRSESRFGPWWRRPWRNLATFMADHLKYGSGNHLLYGPGGHLVWECGSGYTPPASCEVASSLTVVASGISSCGCYFVGGQYQRFEASNGTYTYTFDSVVSGKYRFVAAPNTILYYGYDPDCDGTESTALDAGGVIDITCSGSTYSVYTTIHGGFSNLVAQSSTPIANPTVVSNASSCGSGPTQSGTVTVTLNA